jgi:hypothetical protein
VTIASFPPEPIVTSGSSATGQTSSDEPMQISSSAPRASRLARSIAASSSISPNSTTSGFSTSPQSQRGTMSASSRRRVSASGYDARQARQDAVAIEP